MGARSGGGANGGMGGKLPFGVSKSGRDFNNIPGFKRIKNPEVKKQLIQALVDYDNTFGVRQEDIRLKSLKGALGVHWTTGGQTGWIDLDSKTFVKKDAKGVKATMEYSMNTGFLVKNKQPMRMTLAHEVGHATWNQHMTSPKAQKAGVQFQKIYNAYLKDSKTSASGWGRYSKTNVSEFVAEGITKHIYGKKDKYTKAIAKTIKDFKL